MTYGYVRVSTTDQNIERQIVEMINFGIDRKKIYTDRKSGKDFYRPAYLKLIRKLKENDLLVIKSIDRLGRNYSAIIEEWARITKSIKCDILVLDMPLLDTRIKAENLVGRFISDIVLQILSFVAENERSNIKARQAEGIKLAKLRGVRFGRPKYALPENFAETIQNYRVREVKFDEARSLTGMKTSTFYKYMKMFFDQESNA